MCFDNILAPMTDHITALKPHFRNPGLVRVYVNGEHTFTVPLIDTADLKTGMALTGKRMAQLQRKHELEQAYLTAIRYLGYRRRSRREIKRHLIKKKVPKEIVAQTLSRLFESQLIDDKAFANWWVAHRCRFKPRSTYALRFELLQKGIEESIIAAALADTDDNKMALELLTAKRKQWRRLDHRKKRQRILAFLHRRGFGYDIAKRACEDFIEKTEDRPEDDGP